MLALLAYREEALVRLPIVGGRFERREVAAKCLDGGSPAQHNVRPRLGERGGERQSIWALTALTCEGEKAFVGPALARGQPTVCQCLLHDYAKPRFVGPRERLRGGSLKQIPRRLNGVEHADFERLRDSLSLTGTGDGQPDGHARLLEAFQFTEHCLVL